MVKQWNLKVSPAKIQDFVNYKFPIRTMQRKDLRVNNILTIRLLCQLIKKRKKSLLKTS